MNTTQPMIVSEVYSYHSILMTDLSPAAQAVLDATGKTGTPLELVTRGIAAALRAAADQNPPYDLTTGEYDEGWGEAMAAIFAIAAELEGINNPRENDSND